MSSASSIINIKLLNEKVYFTSKTNSTAIIVLLRSYTFSYANRLVVTFLLMNDKDCCSPVEIYLIEQGL